MNTQFDTIVKTGTRFSLYKYGKSGEITDSLQNVDRAVASNYWRKGVTFVDKTNKLDVKADETKKAEILGAIKAMVGERTMLQVAQLGNQKWHKGQDRECAQLRRRFQHVLPLYIKTFNEYAKWQFVKVDQNGVVYHDYKEYILEHQPNAAPKTPEVAAEEQFQRDDAPLQVVPTKKFVARAVGQKFMAFSGPMKAVANALNSYKTIWGATVQVNYEKYDVSSDGEPIMVVLVQH